MSLGGIRVGGGVKGIEWSSGAITVRILPDEGYKDLGRRMRDASVIKVLK